MLIMDAELWRKEIESLTAEIRKDPSRRHTMHFPVVCQEPVLPTEDLLQLIRG